MNRLHFSRCICGVTVERSASKYHAGEGHEVAYTGSPQFAALHPALLNKLTEAQHTYWRTQDGMTPDVDEYAAEVVLDALVELAAAFSGVEEAHIARDVAALATEEN